MPVTRSISVAAFLLSIDSAPAQLISGIDANVAADGLGTLSIAYTLIGNMNGLLIPLAGAPGRVDGLWRHTCFEAFFGMKDSSGYYEFNFSPSGQWAAYGFRAYRRPRPMVGALSAPDISVQQSADRLRLTAAVQLDQLPAIELGAVMRIGLSAVIESADGALSYWALKHPSPQPDFHHPDSFALEFALPAKSA